MRATSWSALSSTAVPCGEVAGLRLLSFLNQRSANGGAASHLIMLFAPSLRIQPCWCKAAAGAATTSHMCSGGSLRLCQRQLLRVRRRRARPRVALCYRQPLRAQRCNRKRRPVLTVAQQLPQNVRQLVPRATPAWAVQTMIAAAAAADRLRCSQRIWPGSESATSMSSGSPGRRCWPLRHTCFSTRAAEDVSRWQG